MNNPIEGVVSVIGAYGVGKTLFSLTTGHKPEEILFVNDDIKTPPQMSYAGLWQLRNDTANTKSIESYEYTVQLMNDYLNDEDIPNPKVIIWDTWTRFGSWCADYVHQYPGKFRDKWSPNGKIKSGEMYREGRNLELSHISKLKSMCDILILTFHTKQMYLNNNAVPGRVIPEGSRAIAMGSDLRIWLTHNPNGDAPIGLVLKNIAKTSISKSGIEVQKVLPQRLDPCTWGNIVDYWENPVNSSELMDKEKPSPFELNLIEGTLSDEEKRMWLAGASKEDEVESFGEKADRSEEIKQYISEFDITGPPPMMLKSLNELAGDGAMYTMDELMETMG